MQKPSHCRFNPLAVKPSISYELKKIYRPELFQGSRIKNDYFEGWYFKSVSENGLHSISFIPGISLSNDDTHCFVQAINGKTGETSYFRYPADAFSYSDKSFEVTVGPNYFSENKIVLDLSDESALYKGSLEFSDSSLYPVSVKRPGIMGWYRYVPFMECYHGVVSLDHSVSGKIETLNGMLSFDGGRGYIEKDWGTSMPESWIWMQTNNFREPGTSFMMSIAKIPWLGKSFTGFLGYFLHRGKLYPFATYTGAVIKEISETRDKLKVIIDAAGFTLTVRAHKKEKESAKGKLKAPVSGSMERIIHESIDSSIEVELSGIHGSPVLSGTGKNAGFEMAGDISILYP